MPEFDYLNCSSRPEAERVRCILEEWSCLYPLPERAELIARLRSRNNTTHLSAVFELTLYELLRRGGNGVTCHPIVSGGRGKPDFLVEPQTGSAYYLEATLCLETTGDEGGEKLLAQVYDILDRIDSPDFFIGISSHGVPCAPLKVARLRQKLQRWLECLCHDQMTDAWTRGETALAELAHSEAGVRLVFTAIPRRSRGSGMRTIGFQIPEARWGAVSNAIRSDFWIRPASMGNPKYRWSLR
jgi:hypothetical protein